MEPYCPEATNVQGFTTCSLKLHPTACLVEHGYPCETYDEYLKELADEKQLATG